MARQPNPRPKPESSDPQSPAKADTPSATAADRKPAPFVGGPLDGRTIDVDHPLPPELFMLAGVFDSGSRLEATVGPFRHHRYRLDNWGNYQYAPHGD